MFIIENIYLIMKEKIKVLVNQKTGLPIENQEKIHIVK